MQTGRIALILGACFGKNGKGKEPCLCRLGSKEQKIRFERFLIAFSGYGVIFLTSLCFYYAGFLRLSARELALFFLIILLINFLIGGLFVTGLNLRFSDPSLTTIQIVVAVAVIECLMYFTNRYREILSVMFFGVFIFGIFRFSVKRFIFVSFLTIASYAMMIMLLYHNHPDLVNTKSSILNGAILSFCLPWFALIGGYTSELRKKVAAKNVELERAYRKLEKLATTDELTGLLNRRSIFRALEEEIGRSNRYHQNFSLCLLDIDFFKKVNDTFGHLVGDRVLMHVAELLICHSRSTDKIGRYGGEEFMIILPNTSLDGAISYAEKIRKAIEENELLVESEGCNVKVTVSIGVTTYIQEESLEKLISRVDRALYEAKERGRNRVVSLV